MALLFLVSVLFPNNIQVSGINMNQNLRLLKVITNDAANHGHHLGNDLINLL